MRIRRAVVSLVVLGSGGLTGLTACGDDDAGGGGQGAREETPTASQSADDDAGVAACDLLTTDEVEAAVGAPVKEGIARSGEPVTGGTYTSCLWQSDDPGTPADQAQLYIYSNTAAADSSRSDDSEDVPGIGDKAFTVTFAGVWVYLGDQSFLAQWFTASGGEDDSLPMSKALAEAAADKLA